MLTRLKKHKVLANLKKYCYHKDKICFLSFVILAQGIKIKKKQIKVVKNYSKSMSVRNI